MCSVPTLTLLDATRKARTNLTLVRCVVSPRKRNRENRGLPKRWRYRYGTYSYMVPPGQEAHWDGKTEFVLGRTEAEAYKVWAERLDHDGSELDRFDRLAERYRLEVLPDLSPKTQESYRPSICRLLTVFAKLHPAEIRPKHANRYYDVLSGDRSAAVAKSDIGVLRAILSCAVRWGVMDTNPLIGQLRLKGAGSRDRYVEDWEIDAALSLTPTAGNKRGTSRGTEMCQVYIEFKLATGLRRGDILRLPLLDHTKPISVVLRKTRKSSGKKVIIDWTAELHDIVRRIEALPPRRIGQQLLFTTRTGKPYYDEETGRANGFDTIWNRFMVRVVAETAVKERFQEKDIRAKFGSDLDSDQDAADKLGHTSSATAAKHYRRKPSRFTARSRKSTK